MKTDLPYTACILGILLAGGACRPHAPERPQEGWRKAPTDARSGSVIAMSLQKEGRATPILSTKHYAIVILWRGNRRAFYLLDNQVKRFSVTDDFSVFLEELNRLPHAASIEWIEICTATSLSQDMPRAKYKELEEVLRKKGVVARDSMRIVCWAGAKGLRLIDGKQALEGVVGK